MTDIKEITVKKVDSKADLKTFIKIPWTVYKNDKNWVPPLISIDKERFDPVKGAYFKNAEARFFIAFRGDRPVGRIVAHINHTHNEFHKDKVGFFGFFECMPDYEAAEALFRAASDWLKENDRDIIRGPMNYSTNDECGLLVKGFGSPPVVMMTYNPQYYESFIEKFGFHKAKDLVAYFINIDGMPERFEGIIDKIKERRKYTIKKLRKKHFLEDVETIFEIYNNAWQYNWGFVPMTQAELIYLAKELKDIIDFDLAYIVYIDNKPIAFSLTLPDVNQALIKVRNGRLLPFGWLKLLLGMKQIDQVRVVTLGIVKNFKNIGIDTVLYYETIKTSVEKGMPRGEMSWVLEDNIRMCRPIERMGGKVYKTYRVYDKELS
ncbi:MAG TPA: N-acetyltransferase [Candidatus Cloacimonetes bacterium]|nr:N-acetyltransferase [Candidatus Cloacimonadota bacterium]